MSEIINIKGLTKSFCKQNVINNLDLVVAEGDIIGITGRNGSGKSVLFKLICGLMLPTSGEVIVLGRQIHKGKFPEDIGIKLDNEGFISYESGFNNLKHISKIKNTITDEDIKNCISLVGLDPSDKKPVKKYSLGMKQRLGIALAIMEKPKLIILDEPMNAIDAETVNDMRNLLLKLNKEHNMTILISSHNDEDISYLCNRVLKFQNGRLIEI